MQGELARLRAERLRVHGWPRRQPVPVGRPVLQEHDVWERGRSGAGTTLSRRQLCAADRRAVRNTPARDCQRPREDSEALQVAASPTAPLGTGPGFCRRGEAALRFRRRVRAMLASRACRSSIMIGRTLDRSSMRRVVDNLAGLESPWNCPHGRPTMRHLAVLRN